MKVLGLIPARGGSKRLPRKNILDFCGKPLIVWTIEAARKALLITETWVSTEDAEISQIAKDYGANVLYRPPALAQDDTRSADVVRHVLTMLPRFDYVCLLQPTSPLRTPDDIDECVKLAFKIGECVSVCGTEQNGAVYVLSTERHWPADWTVLYQMPAERSIDINTDEDFRKAEEYGRKD